MNSCSYTESNSCVSYASLVISTPQKISIMSLQLSLDSDYKLGIYSCTTERDILNYTAFLYSYKTAPTYVYILLCSLFFQCSKSLILEFESNTLFFFYTKLAVNEMNFQQYQRIIMNHLKQGTNVLMKIGPALCNINDLLFFKCLWVAKKRTKTMCSVFCSVQKRRETAEQTGSLSQTPEICNRGPLISTLGQLHLTPSNVTPHRGNSFND